LHDCLIDAYSDKEAVEEAKGRFVQIVEDDYNHQCCEHPQEFSIDTKLVSVFHVEHLPIYPLRGDEKNLLDKVYGVRSRERGRYVDYFLDKEKWDTKLQK